MSATSMSSDTLAGTPALPSQTPTQFYGDENDKGQSLELLIVNHTGIITLPPFMPLPEFMFDRYYFRLNRLTLSNQGGTNPLVKISAAGNEAIEQLRSYLTPADLRRLEEFLIELHASYTQATSEGLLTGRLGTHNAVLQLDTESLMALNAAIQQITSVTGYDPHERNFALNRR